MTYINETLSLGKIDYNQTGRKVNIVEINIKLIDGNLSISGYIWNSRKTDVVCAGQCFDTLEHFFKNNNNVLRLIEIWKRWHLNDMHPGSPNQSKFLNKLFDRNGHFTYELIIDSLTKNDLLYDKEYLVDGKPYQYGSAWLKEEIPQEVINDLLQIIIEIENNS